MGKVQRNLTIAMWAMTVVAVSAFLALGQFGGGAHAPAPTDQSPGLFKAPEFALVDQNSKPFSSAQLQGQVWICDFIFTHCENGGCPRLSGRMSVLQDKLKGADVKLISFTMDPERDTAEVLKQWSRQFAADESRWKFLTGTRAQMDALIAGMKVEAEPTGKDGQYLHTQMMMLIDGEGRVRSLRSATRDEEMDALAAEARALAAGDESGLK